MKKLIFFLVLLISFSSKSYAVKFLEPNCYYDCLNKKYFPSYCYSLCSYETETFELDRTIKPNPKPPLTSECFLPCLRLGFSPSFCLNLCR